MAYVLADKFLCRTCSEEKDISEWHKGSYMSKAFVSKCKRCHNEYNLRYQLEQRLSQSPENYYSCLDCERVFYYKNNKCPECKSENFDDYIS